MQVQYVPAHYLQQVWPKVEPLLEEALEFSAGEYDVRQLKVFLSTGAQQLLIAVDEDGEVCGAASVEWINYPNDRVAFVTAIAGSGVPQEDTWAQICEWARVNGATKIRGAAREAIARLWKAKFGFTQRYIIVEKQL